MENEDIQIERITAVTPQLVKEVAALANQLGPAYPVSLSVKKLEQIVRCPTNTLLVAFDSEKRAIGMLLMISFPAVTGSKTWIEDVVVDKHFRRKGVAHKLFNKILSIAKKQKVTYVNLSVRSHRLEANRLYEKLGFKKHETNYYRYILKE